MTTAQRYRARHRITLFALAPLASVVVGCSSTTEGSPVPGPTLATSAPITACSVDGISIKTGGTDAAMGLRSDSLVLTNCGTQAITLNGAATVTLFDADRKALPIMATRGVVDVGMDNPAATAITVRPGDTAWAGLSWRNTNVDGEGAALTAKSLQVRARSDMPPVSVDLHVDLGTTGKFYVTVWQAGPA